MGLIESFGDVLGGGLKRAGRVAHSTYRMGQAPLGVIKDLAVAPFTDDEYGGALDTLVGIFRDRGGQAFEEGVGPQGVLGEAVGGLPEGVRGPGRAVVNPVMEAMETAYREGVGEPISTLITVGGVDESQLGFLDPSNWREAYRIAQNRSPGQAAALAAANVDINDDEDLKRAMGSDWFELTSGLLDVTSRIFLDPTVVGGKTMAAVRGARTAATTAAIRDGMHADRLMRFMDEIEPMDAGKVRDLYFPKEKHGGVVAELIKSAPSKEDAVETVRALMGSPESLAAVRSRSAAVGNQIDRLVNSRYTEDSLTGGILTSQGRIGGTPHPQALTLFDDAAERYQNIQAEIEELHPVADRLARLESFVAAGTLREAPPTLRTSLAGRNIPTPKGVRATVTRSDFYQTSHLAAPLRVAFGMNPQRHVDLDAPDADVHFERIAQRAKSTPSMKRDAEWRDAQRSRYLAAQDPATKARLFAELEDDVIRSIAEDAGLDVEDIENAVRVAQRGRAMAAERLNSRTYDGEGRSRVEWVNEDGTPEVIHVPLVNTQQVNVHVTTNWRAVEKAAKRWGQAKARHPGAATRIGAVREASDMFHRQWRVGVLLRGGWPIRVVGDEQGRIVAKIGALAQGRNLGVAISNKWHDLPDIMREKGVLRTETQEGAKFVRTPKAERAFRQPGWREPVLVPHGDEVVEIESAFGGPFGDMWAKQNSAKQWRNLTGQREDEILNELRRTGQYVSLHPVKDADSWGKGWADAVNRQIGQDQMGRLLLQGHTPDEVARWLRGGTIKRGDEVIAAGADGLAYARKNPIRRRDPDAWAEDVADQIHRYTLDSEPSIVEAALQGKASLADVERIAPDANLRPLIHGEVLAQAMGTSPLYRVLNSGINGAMDRLGRAPSDFASRNPYFDHTYRAEVTRLVELLPDGPVSQATRNQIAQQARNYAMGETKNLLYDLAEQSRFAELLGNLSPFYMAWQEVITRWAGLAVENPAFVRRAQLAFSAPEKAGLVVDEDGNRILPGGGAIDQFGKRVKAGADRYITLSLPDVFAKMLPGVREGQEVRLNKRSFNMVLQGTPGVGPLVQVPVNELVKNMPQLEDSVKFILPFGTTQEIRDLILPATAKRVTTLLGGEDERLYANTTVRIFNDMVVDFNLGKRAERPSYEEAKKATDAHFALRAAASFLSPIAPTFTSPYQPYIEAYRALKEREIAEDKDPGWADDQFITRYGEEFFPLTQSLSKSMDGIPPTIESFEKRQEFADFIEALEDPQLGGLVVGAEGAGEFSGAVYDHQLATRLRPGSPHMQRETPAFEEVVSRPAERLGWMKYRSLMDVIDAERMERGLPNLQVKEAQDLSDLKRAGIEAIATQHPEWYAQFSQVDRQSFERRLRDLTKIASNPTLLQREEIQTLRTYLGVRALMVEELSQRESVTLNAASNQDLAELWEEITTQLADSNPAFADLFFRYLEHDSIRGEREEDDFVQAGGGSFANPAMPQFGSAAANPAMAVF